jgi:3-hydroxyacyl-CoA dehydrogenase
MTISLLTLAEGAKLEIGTVGVVGAGVMGAGVAQSLAQSEGAVILVDLNGEILERARRQSPPEPESA